MSKEEVLGIVACALGLPAIVLVMFLIDSYTKARIAETCLEAAKAGVELEQCQPTTTGEQGE